MCLVEYQSFWTDPICSGWAQIILERSKLGIQISQEKSNLNLTKMIWTQPKQLLPVQNNWDCPKSFWTYRRTIHDTFAFLDIFGHLRTFLDISPLNSDYEIYGWYLIVIEQWPLSIGLESLVGVGVL